MPQQMHTGMHTAAAAAPIGTYTVGGSKHQRKCNGVYFRSATMQLHGRPCPRSRTIAASTLAAAAAGPRLQSLSNGLLTVVKLQRHRDGLKGPSNTDPYFIRFLRA